MHFAGSSKKLVMQGLIRTLLARTHTAYIASGPHPGLKHLVNDVVGDDTDFEHLLTFLEDTPASRYQAFALELRSIFSVELRAALEEVRQELGDKHSALYAVLLDMHEVRGSGEELRGFLSLNYDVFLEHAIEQTLDGSVDYGVTVAPADRRNRAGAVPVLKLHGSFGWQHTWPIEIAGEADAGLWIPPGIRKAKGEYPFNAIWGAARELLDCDILRIIGCNLGPNDWDLISLLFTTMHGRETGRPYDIEVIGWPADAQRIAETFPYFTVKSLLTIDEIGPQLVAEVLSGKPRSFLGLDEGDQERALASAASKIANPFEHWLRLKGELMLSDLQTLETDHGLFSEFVESSV